MAIWNDYTGLFTGDEQTAVGDIKTLLEANHYPYYPHLALADADDIRTLLLSQTYTDDVLQSLATFVKNKAADLETGGNALEFDNSGQWMKVPKIDEYDFEEEKFTLEAWIKLSSSAVGEKGIVVRRSANGPVGSRFSVNIGNSGDLSFTAGFTTVDTNGAYNFKDDQWHHVAMTMQGDTIKFYKDGTQLGGDKVLYNLTYGGTLLVIGKTWENDTNSFQGEIKDVRIWNYHRTQTQLNNNKYKLLTGAEPGLIGYWRCDEGKGQTIKDYSNNQNHGYLGSSPSDTNEDPTWGEGIILGGERWDVLHKVFHKDLKPAIDALVANEKLLSTDFDTYFAQTVNDIAQDLLAYDGSTQPNDFWLPYSQYLISRANSISDQWLQLATQFSDYEQETVINFLNIVQQSLDGPITDFEVFAALGVSGIASIIANEQDDTSDIIRYHGYEFMEKAREIVEGYYVDDDEREMVFLDSYPEDEQPAIESLLEILKASLSTFSEITEKFHGSGESGSITVTTPASGGVSEVQEFSLIDVKFNDSITLDLNGNGAITYTFTKDDLEDPEAALATFINSSTTGDWGSVTATSPSNVVVTWDATNVAFTMTKSSSVAEEIDNLAAKHAYNLLIANRVFNEIGGATDTAITTYEYRGTLLKLDGEDNDEVLKKYRIKVSKVGSTVEEIGVVYTDSEGKFEVDYQVANGAETSITLRFSVYDSKGLNYDVVDTIVGTPAATVDITFSTGDTTRRALYVDGLLESTVGITTTQAAGSSDPQIDQVIPSNIHVGDLFVLDLNYAGQVEFVATTTAPEDTIAGLKTAIENATGGDWSSVTPSEVGSPATALEITANVDDTPFTLTFKTIPATKIGVTLADFLGDGDISITVSATLQESLGRKNVYTLEDINAMGGLAFIDGNLTIKNVLDATASSGQEVYLSIPFVTEGDVFTIDMNGNGTITYIATDNVVATALAGIKTEIDTAGGGDWSTLVFTVISGNELILTGPNNTAFTITQEKILEEDANAVELNAKANMYSGAGFLKDSLPEQVIPLLNTLYDNGFTSLGDITATPDSEVLTLIKQVIGDVNAMQFKIRSIVETKVLENLVRGIKMRSQRFTNNDPESIEYKFNTLFDEYCYCEPCESATSPLAYLSDLINYALQTFRTSTDVLGDDLSTPAKVDTRYFYNVLHQNLIELPSKCDSVFDLVCQVKVAVEVIRKQLELDVPSEAAHAKLAIKLEAWLEEVYEAFLNGIGTSYEELRTVCSTKEKRALAERLSIDYDYSPDFIDRLLLKFSNVATWADFKATFHHEEQAIIQGLEDDANIYNGGAFSTFTSETSAEIKARIDGASTTDEFFDALATLVKDKATTAYDDVTASGAYSKFTSTELGMARYEYFKSIFPPAFVKPAMLYVDYLWENNGSTAIEVLKDETLANIASAMKTTVSGGLDAIVQAITNKRDLMNLTSGTLSERGLESAFGWVATDKDIYSRGAKEGDPNDYVKRWSVQGEKWDYNTDEDGYIYLKLVLPDTIELYKDSGRTAQVGLALLDEESNKFIISETSHSGLYGEFLLNGIDDDSNIKIAIIPAYIAEKLKALKVKWQSEDSENVLPLIDPDLIGPADISYPYDIDTGSPVNPIDFWQKRRDEVDTELAAIQATREGYSDANYTESGKIDNGHGIAVADDGKIYVSDSTTNKIELFNANGTYNSEYLSGLGGARGLEIFHDGSATKIGYCEATNNQVKIHTLSSGTLTTTLGGFSSPTDLAVDKQKNLFITDSNNDKIVRYTLPLLQGFNSEGDLNAYIGVATDRFGRIYIADSNNDRVLVFDQEENFLHMHGTGTSGSGLDELHGAKGIYIDDSLNIYIADTSNSRVLKFDSDWNFLTLIGGVNGSGTGEFNEPLVARTDSQGNIFVVDRLNNRIQYFDEEGSYLGEFKDINPGVDTLAQPHDITFDDDDNVYVADTNNDRIVKFDLQSDGTYLYASKWDGLTLDSPKGILRVKNQSGNDEFIIADTTNSRLIKVDDSGTLISGMELSSSTYDGLYSFSEPKTMGVDANGYLFVADKSSSIGKVRKLRFPYEWGTSGSGPGQLDEPRGIAVDEAGGVYVMDTGANNRVQKFDEWGNLQEDFIDSNGDAASSFTHADFDEPFGITLDKAGNMYICNNATSGAVIRFNAQGKKVASWTSVNGTNLTSPKQAFIDENGVLFITNPGEDVISKLDIYKGLGETFENHLENESATGQTLNDFIAIKNDFINGKDIEADLESLQLSFVSFGQLLRVYELLGCGVELTDDLWESVYAILAQSWKQHQYATWKTEEENNNIYLGNVHFHLKNFSEESILELPEWIADAETRIDWIATLNTRIERVTTVFNQHKKLLSDVEGAFLPDLRDLFLEVSGFVGNTLAEKGEEATEKLFLDFRMKVCQQTTRIELAIEALGGILWGIQTKQTQDDYPGWLLSGDLDKINEEMKWMGSYKTWSAAQQAFLYPENLLSPSTRANKNSAVFKNIMEDMRERPELTNEQALEYFDQYKNAVEGVDALELVDSCSTNNGKLFLIWKGRATDTGQNDTYYSIVNKDDFTDTSEILKVPIDFKAGLYEIMGCMNYTQYEPGKVVLFIRNKEIGELTNTMAAYHYDLNFNRWSEESLFSVTSKEFLFSPVPALGLDKSYKTPDSYYFRQQITNIIFDRGSVLSPAIGVIYSTLLVNTKTNATAINLINGFEYYAYNGGNTLTPLKGSSVPQAWYSFSASKTINYGSHDVFAGFRITTNSDGTRKLFNTTFTAEDEAVMSPVIVKSKTDITGYIYNPTANTLVELTYYNLALSVKEYTILQDVGFAQIFSRNGVKYALFQRKENGNIILGEAVFEDDTVRFEPIHILIQKGFDLSFVDNFLSDENEEIKEKSQANYLLYKNLKSSPEFARMEEVHYFLPLQIATFFQKQGQYEKALFWYSKIYDWSKNDPDPKTQREKRAIYYGLYDKFNAETTYEREDDESTPDNSFDWLKDPLNPHAIAGSRSNVYTKFTVMSIAGCMIDYADTEYATDRSENIARARTLYNTALELLQSEDIVHQGEECVEIVNAIDFEPEKEWELLWERVKQDVLKVKKKKDFDTMVSYIKSIIALGGYDTAEKIGYIREKLQSYLSSADIVEELYSDTTTNLQATNYLQLDEGIQKLVKDMTTTVTGQFYDQLSSLLGIDKSKLIKDEIWEYSEGTLLHALVNGTSLEELQGVLDLTDPANITGDVEDLEEQYKDDYVKAQGGRFGPSWEYKLFDFATDFKKMLDFDLAYQPETDLRFCVPPNPQIEALIYKAENNLAKIRCGINIAGLKRPLEPYASKTIGSGIVFESTLKEVSGTDQEIFTPTIYRYDYLIERAKQLVSIAQQLESSLLSALEKLDAAEFSVLEARQALGITNAGVGLHELRVVEANNGIDFSKLQKQRSEVQYKHYNKLILEGLLPSEKEALDQMERTVKKQKQAGIFKAVATVASTVVGIVFPPAGVAISLAVTVAGEVTKEVTKTGSSEEGKKGAGAGASIVGTANLIAGGLDTAAGVAQTQASIASTRASYERREQEWEFQRALAKQDIRIAKQQVQLAKDRYAISNIERDIAVLQQNNAREVLEFLYNRFTGRELYDFMAGVMEEAYFYFLKQATSVAKMAINQLRFERQQLIPGFIKEDYWEIPANMAAKLVQNSEGSITSRDRKGITGSTRLLQDIYQVDQFAFETDVRKLELSKSLSLANFAPTEFYQFRKDGKITFEIPEAIFERDYPGHYLRLIKSVTVTVVALVAPVEGVKATVRNYGISYTTVGTGNDFRKIQITKDPESIALSSAQNGSGILQLQPNQNLKLLPFENLGIESKWEIEMPKASNFFDYDTIADVIVTVQYTALESRTLQQQVQNKLNSNQFRAERAFSLKSSYPDQWYDLNNPKLSATPMEVTFETSEQQFPVNISNLEIENLVMYFVKGADFDPTTESIAITVDDFKFTAEGETESTTALSAVADENGIISTRKPNGKNWLTNVGQGLNGTWRFKLPYTSTMKRMFKEERIYDIVFVIGYKGDTPKFN